LARELAGEMKAGVDIDGAHALPGFVANGQRVIRLAPRRCRAVHKMRHLSDGGARIGQQRVASIAMCEITHPWYGELRPR
jgi:hypothetical protein